MRTTKKNGITTFHYTGSIVDNINKSEKEIEKLYTEINELESEFMIIDKIHEDYKSRINKKKRRIDDLKIFMELLFKDYLDNKKGDN